MAIHPIVLEELEKQYDLVVALETPQIIAAAKSIAFYCAMLDAQIDDPMDAPESNEEIRTFFLSKHDDYVAEYQNLVNAEL